MITGDYHCRVRVSLTNSIQLTARFSMPFNQFFVRDGKTKFVDRIVALLNINDMSRVKIVGIYPGSVKVVAFIDEELTEE